MVCIHHPPPDVVHGTDRVYVPGYCIIAYERVDTSTRVGGQCGC